MSDTNKALNPWNQKVKPWQTVETNEQPIEELTMEDTEQCTLGRTIEMDPDRQAWDMLPKREITWNNKSQISMLRAQKEINEKIVSNDFNVTEETKELFKELLTLKNIIHQSAAYVVMSNPHIQI